MKCQTYVYPPHTHTQKFLTIFVLAVFFFAAQRVCLVMAAASEQEQPVPVTSGPVFDSVSFIDPSISLQESSTCLFVTREFTGDDAKSNIRQFMWDIVHVAQMPAVWAAYSEMSCTYMCGADMGNVFVSNYNTLLDFSTAHINMVQNADNSSLFDAFYYAVFGARDLSIVQEKQLYDLAQQTGLDGYSLPEKYRAGYLWVYSAFDGSCGYSVRDDAISLQVIAQNTEAGGKAAVHELTSAADLFNRLYDSDPLAMPYTKIQLQYQDSSGSALWEWCSEKENGSWSVTKNSCNSAAFADGIKAAAN